MTHDPQAAVELIAETHVTEAQRSRGLFFLAIVVGAVGFAVTLQLGVNSSAK